MTDEFPQTYQALVSTLSRGGSLSFDIPTSKKAAFRRCIARINMLERLCKQQEWYFKPYVFVYATYCGVMQAFATSGNDELGRALLTYQTAWNYVRSITGEDIPDNKMRITFVGIQ